MRTTPALSGAVQLRIGFSEPSHGCVLGLTLSGLTVVASVWMGSHTDAWHHLRAAGIDVSLDDERDFCFAATQLTRLTELADSVRCEALGPLSALLPVLLRPEGAPPAAISVDGAGALSISHVNDVGVTVSATLERPAVAALLASECPFVATPDAWETLEGSAGFPVTAATASLNHDGFIEIAAHRPQLVAAAPVPGLFRIDDRHFGAPVSSYAAIRAAAGFRWSGRRPAKVPVPLPPRRLEGQMSAHVASDAVTLAHQLAQRGAAVIVYPPRSGRRLLAVAALEALEAYPALVLCPPRTLWLWQRHLDLVGRPHSVSDPDAEVRLCTYLDLAAGERPHDPAAIVFDDVCSSEAQSPRARAAASELGLFCDALRLGVADSWPQDPEEACATLEVMRPAEFDVSAGLAWRYPHSPVQRCAEHTGAYLFTRQGADQGDSGGFATFTVREVEAPAELRAAAAGAASVDAACEVVSAGTAELPSAKLAAAFSVVSDAVAAGRRVVVLTRHRRTAVMLRATLARFGPAQLGSADVSELASAPLAVCRWGPELPDVRRFDVAVFCEWPASTAALDAAIGAAGDSVAAAEVVVLHSSGTVDDRLAAHAATQGDRGVSSDAEARAALDERWALSQRG